MKRRLTSWMQIAVLAVLKAMAAAVQWIAVAVVAVVRWVGRHANKVRSAIWQVMLALVALGVITLDEAQLAVIGMALSAVLDLFVEDQTVAKSRVGERIDAEVARRTGDTAF